MFFKQVFSCYTEEDTEASWALAWYGIYTEALWFILGCDTENALVLVKG